ncbi:hypothetical protein BVG19_g3667 [[Candida] boidinii]|nr:hypothetical protein BVG19_g3667 [[Candida] boidinii]OWB51742.1 hypothetical protein B5S27_g3308 [[Candida] boidinii]
MSATSEQNQEQQTETVEETVKLIVKLPEEPGKIEFPVTFSDSINDIKQTLALLPATQHYTNFEFYYNSTKINLFDTLGDAVDSEKIKEELTIELKAIAYNERTAREHLSKVRRLTFLDSTTLYEKLYDINGLAAGYSTYSDLELGPVQEDLEAEEKEVEEKAEEKSEEETKGEEKEEESEKAPKFKELSEDEKLAVTASVAGLETKRTLSDFAGKELIKALPTVKSLAISSWSPAPQDRKLKGDLFYIQFQSLEGETYHITSHVTGFYVNSSSVARFNPSPKVVSSQNGKSKLSRSHNLYTLLKNLSPKLLEQLGKNYEILTELMPELYNSPSNSFLANPWLVNEKSINKSPDLAISQSTYIEGGLDAADFTKDWNDEFQNVRELPNSNIQDRIIREKILNKTSYDFTNAAIKGAMAIVRGEIEPFEPTDDPEHFIYLRNGIFYSYSVDNGTFESTGGNEARYTSSKDLAGVRCLNRLDTKGVHHILTTIVDYCGKRIIAQAPVPGIFNESPLPEQPEGEEKPEGEERQEPEIVQKIIYGYSVDGDDVNADEDLNKKFKNISNSLHLKSHKYWNKSGSKSVELISSGETKGIKGTDGRDYIIDLYRTTPLDIEFIEANYKESDETSYPHRETTIRHEAVEEWWRRQVGIKFKQETEKFEKDIAERKAKGEEIDESEKPTIAIEEGAYSLNPDAFNLAKDVAPSKEDAEALASDEKDVREVSKFISEILIPEFFNDYETGNIIPADGKQLSSNLHGHGINIRYLGQIAQIALDRKEKALARREKSATEIEKKNAEILEKRKQREEDAEKRIKEAFEEAAKKAKEEGASEEEIKNKAQTAASEVSKKISSEVEESEKAEEAAAAENEEKTEDVASINSLLTILYNLSVQDMVSRAVKHILNRLVSDTPLCFVPHVIAHIHNALLGQVEEFQIDEAMLEAYPEANLDALKLSKESVIEIIEKEVYIRFRYQLPSTWNTELIRPVSLLREIALKYGIQWKDRKFYFSKEEIDAQVALFEKQQAIEESEFKKSHKSKKNSKTTKESIEFVSKSTFVPDDVLCIVPVVKDSIYGSTLVEEIWEAARIRVNNNEVEEGLSIFQECISIYEQVYGTLHPATAKAYNSLAQIYADLKHFPESCAYARKAYRIYERTTGIDSVDSFGALSKIAYGESQNKSLYNSIQCYKHLIDLYSNIYGEDHPTIVTCLTSIAISLQNFQLVNESLKVFENAVSAAETTYGKDSQMVAYVRYQYAHAYASNSQLNKSVKEMQAAFEIFKNELGLSDPTTKKTEKWYTSLERYVTITARQEKMLKEAEAARLKEERKEAAAASSIVASSKSNDKGKKSKRDISPDPEISKQSVDDIMKFIEGGNTPSKKKSGKKNGKK